MKNLRINRVNALAAAAFVCASACLVSVAWSATYNFYFNNTEQGPNSTANPSLSVTQSADGKIEKKEGGQELKPAGEKTGEGASVVNAVASTSGTGESTASLPANEHKKSRQFRRWRVTPAYSYTRETGGFTLKNGVERYNYGSGFGFNLTLGYHFNRDLGINLFGSYTNLKSGGETKRILGGAELEFMPVHISFGRFDDLIELGLVGGASTLGAVNGNIVSAHVGAKGRLNLGESWSLTGVARGNAGFKSIETGLTFHL